MSDLCMYELEDNVWDEFGESDDHIVPRPGDDDADKCAVQSDICKRARHEVIDTTDRANNATKYHTHGKEDRMSKKDTMLENGSWSQTPDGVFPCSSDGESIREVTGITTNDSRMSGHCHKGDNMGSVGSEFCANDRILADSNNNTYDYPLGLIPQIDNELSFYDNINNINGEDKESSDLLYDGWPDIGNFEDVDRMFRSCDSTFGLGNLGNDDDELCWFPPPRSTRGPEEALKSGFKLSCHDSSVLENVAEQIAPSVPNDTGPSIEDSDRNSVSLCDQISRQTTDDDLAASGHIQFVNELDAKSENSFQPIYKGQISLQRKHSKDHSHSDAKRKDYYSENGDSFHHSSNLKQVGDVKHALGDSSKSNKMFPPTDIRQYKQNIGPAPLGYMQTRSPYMHLDFSNPSGQISVPTLSGTNSESNNHPSPSPKKSSHTSNQVQSADSCHGPLSKPAAVTNEKKKRVHGRQDVQASFSGNSKRADIASPTKAHNRVSVQKQMHQSENEIDGHSDVEGVGIAAELDSSNVQESTCMSSVLDEDSLQATSFRQLQQVMEQLDIRTKLCIRDSLYRLAKSAEQRHNCLNPSVGPSNDRDVNGALVADETNKCTGFMDIETNTNPIDRSIAHLLFHRSPDSSVHGSLLNPPISEKQIFQEIAAGTDNKLLRDSEK